MSAWEGSAWQLAQEAEKRRREDEIDSIQRDNPWLSRQQCEQWQRQEEERRRAAVPAKCCPCNGRRPGVVQDFSKDRAGSVLCICKCSCHEGAR